MTATFTVPAACAGATALTSVGETNVTVLEPVEANATPAPGTKPVPVIVTAFPPMVGPATGLTAVTVGAP